MPYYIHYNSRLSTTREGQAKHETSKKSNMVKFMIAIVALCITLGAVLYAPATIAQSTFDDVKIINTLNFDLPLNDAPKPSPGYYKYLDQCASKISEECGNEVFVGMFYAEPLTIECCVRLLAMGRECHDALAQKMIHSPQLKPLASMASRKSVEIWDVCSESVAASPSLF